MSWTPREQVAAHRLRRRQGVDVPDTFPEDHPIHVRNAPTGWAPTKSCPGCFYGPKRFDHSTACVARLKAMREDVPQAAPAAPAVPTPLTLVPPPPGLEPVAIGSRQHLRTQSSWADRPRAQEALLLSSADETTWRRLSDHKRRGRRCASRRSSRQRHRRRR